MVGAASLPLREAVTRLRKTDAQYPFAASISKSRDRLAMPCLCEAERPPEFRMGSKPVEPRITGKARETVEGSRNDTIEQRERALNVTDVRADACQIEESFRIMEA